VIAEVARNQFGENVAEVRSQRQIAPLVKL